MRAPYSWLKDFAPFDLPAAEFAAVLDGLGMVVEHMDHVGEGLDGVVVVKVLDIRDHPNADRMRIVDVDTGDGEALQIVCGAFNFGVGDVVPLATIGTTLPNGLTISRAKKRGEWSNGMLCAADELGMGSDHAGLLVLDPGLAIGAPLKEALGIESDTVFDLDITSNRPDAMCMAGVARDAAAKLRLPFALPEPVVAGTGPATATLVSVAIEAPELCARFTARVIQEVTVGSSTPVVQRRLTLAGMRPINNVVDASNYVMLELGQPTHPYDLARLPGPGLVARAAREGEVVKTLDDNERAVSGLGVEVCVIADGNGDAVGIGGIMGGASSDITEQTSAVVLEAAWFTPMAIAWASKRLNLRTEASARFERGCDIEAIARASDRFCELVGSGTVSSGLVDVRTAPPAPRSVTVRPSRINGLLGTALATEAIVEQLAPIGFVATPTGADSLEVSIPSWRPDCAIEEDITEEVGRHFGFGNIANAPLTGARRGGLSPFQQNRRLLRWVLTGAGVSEATNPPLLGPGDHERAGIDGSAAILAANPMIREESILRLDLRPQLLRNLAYNASHRNPGVRLFEIGKVFGPVPAGQELPDEREHLGVVLHGRDAADAVRLWRAVADSFRLDHPMLEATTRPGLHPGRTAAIVAGGAEIGVVGEIDPDVVSAFELQGPVGWLHLEVPVLFGAPTRSLEQRPVSRYPSSDIDLAFVVAESTAAGAVEATLREAAGPLLADLALFDVYRGPGVEDGCRSLAFRLRFQAEDRTLTDADVAQVRDACIAAVQASHPAVLRG